MPSSCLPGAADWSQSKVVPCFYYQPVEEVGSGVDAALLPVGQAEWRCRFAPETVGIWQYKVRAADAGGMVESPAGQFTAITSRNKGFIQVSGTDPRFFEFSDGTPFVTPLVNVEEGNPFITLSGVRQNIRKMGESGVRFVRWFPTGEGANYSVAPFGDSMRINWGFGDGWETSDGPDVAAGKRFSYAPYYYSSQSVPVVPRSRYRLSFRAKVMGQQALRSQIGDLNGGTLDICSASGTYHASQRQVCTYKQDGWRDYALEVEVGDPSPAVLSVALRGLYVSADAPAPYNSSQQGSIRVHSIRFQRDETGQGGWGPDLLLRSDPDTYRYVDQRAAAYLDEILALSERYGVYHKLPLFHKNDAILGRFLSDGSVGSWDVNHFYSAEGQAARWYEMVYARYFVARWSYSTALHSLELANENNFDSRAQDAAFAIAAYVRQLSPRHILQSNSFWGWWVDSYSDRSGARVPDGLLGQTLVRQPSRILLCDHREGL